MCRQWFLKNIQSNIFSYVDITDTHTISLVVYACIRTMKRVNLLHKKDFSEFSFSCHMNHVQNIFIERCSTNMSMQIKQGLCINERWYIPRHQAMGLHNKSRMKNSFFCVLTCSLTIHAMRKFFQFSPCFRDRVCCDN